MDHHDISAKSELDICFVPSRQKVVDKMLALANVTADDVVYDLGCGDGRIVITAAQKYGARGIGFDLDPQRLKESRANVKKAGVADLVQIRKRNIFAVDLREATVVTLYLLGSLNDKLLPQLSRLPAGARIVTQSYDFLGIRPARRVTVKQARQIDCVVYLWKAPLE